MLHYLVSGINWNLRFGFPSVNPSVKLGQGVIKIIPFFKYLKYNKILIINFDCQQQTDMEGKVY
jgi:hypothetical protein